GTGGIIESHPGTGFNDPSGIVVDASGIYVVGYDSALGGSAQEWRIEKRNRLTGSLTWTITANPSTFAVSASIAVDSSGVYVAGPFFPQGGTGSGRIEKRSLGPIG